MNESQKFREEIIIRKGNTVNVNTKELEAPILLLFLVGDNEKKIGDWRKWEWKTSKFIQPTPDLPDNMVLQFNIEDAKDLKGYLVLNEKGDILLQQFNPIVKQILVGMSLQDEKGRIIHTEKFSIGKIDLLDDMIPLELKEFSFDKHKDLTQFLIKYLTEKTKRTKATIRIIDPYLSFELFEILDSSCDRGTKIHILTTTFSGNKKKTEKQLLKKIKALRNTKREVTIKQIREVGRVANLKKRDENPFHDRIIIDDTGGLVIGISLNGLYKNSTFVTVFKDGQKIRDTFDQWFNGKEINFRSKLLKFIEWFPK